MTPEQKQIIRSALTRYAWPGGYPVYSITEDGGILCPGCVKSETKLIITAIRDNDNNGWLIYNSDINWEDPGLYCDHCGEHIESAYAEED